MSTQIECPICMDCIESTTKNCVTTECGHCFHASCLMTNVAHNGFGCPYCRAAMAEEPADDESTEYESVDEDEVDPLEDNDMLRGFRFFFNNVNGEEHDEDDVEEEIANESEDEEEDNEDEEPKPSAEFITQKLVQQGVTMEQLVKALLMGHEEYQNDENSRVDDELFGKMRIIISNFTPEQTVQPIQPVQLVQSVLRVNPIQPPEVDYISAPSSRIIQSIGRLCSPEVDFSAQPKHIVRRIMMHV